MLSCRYRVKPRAAAVGWLAMFFRRHGYDRAVSSSSSNNSGSLIENDANDAIYNGKCACAHCVIHLS